MLRPSGRSRGQEYPFGELWRPDPLSLQIPEDTASYGSTLGCPTPIGEVSIQRKLEQLGFEVVVGEKSDASGILTSERLAINTVYKRDDLRSLFGITDATPNTGVFRPRCRLEGETFFWRGQTSGRTDSLIIEHQVRGLELSIP